MKGYEIDFAPSESKQAQVMAAERVRRVAVQLQEAEAKVRQIMDGPEGLVEQVRAAHRTGVPLETLSMLTGITDGRLGGWT